MNMDFFRRREPAPRDFTPDMRAIGEAMHSSPQLQRRPDPFAPAREVARAIATIDTFGALPLKEIDDQLAALKREMAETEALGQKIRDIIMEVRAEYLEKLDHSQAVNRLTRESLAQLAERVSALDDPPADEPADLDQPRDGEKPLALEHEQGEAA